MAKEGLKDKVRQFSQKLKGIIPPADCPLTKYAINSIKTGESNYPVENLMTFLNSCGSHLIVSDIMDEETHIHTVKEAHAYIVSMLAKYKCKMSEMNESVGVTYTPPTKTAAPLSIGTFLGILEYFNCEKEFVPCQK